MYEEKKINRNESVCLCTVKDGCATAPSVGPFAHIFEIWGGNCQKTFKLIPSCLFNSGFKDFIKIDSIISRSQS